MISYSAVEAISPAIERTKQFLFQPFRLGRFLKLTLVALLTEGGISSCNFNSSNKLGNHGGSTSSAPWHMPSMHVPTMPVVLGIVAVVLLIVIPIGILISYLLIRLRFSFFECLLYRQDRIAPAWSRYHRQAMRYLGLTLCIGLAFWIVLIPVGYAIFQHFHALFQSIGSDNPPGFFDFLPVIAVALPIFLVFSLAGFLIEVMIGNFVLPRMAIEDTSIQESLEAVWDDIRIEPGQFTLFVIMRILLSIAATILALIALLVPLLILAGVVVVLVLIFKAISTTLAIALGIPAGILALILMVAAFIGVGGTIGTFKRNYAILFYAGRYADLAAILWPVLPLPPWEGGIASGPSQGV